MKIYLLLAPDYGSMGDQAICYAEKKYLKKIYPSANVLVFDEKETIKNIDYICQNLEKEDLIFLQGGGNMGSLYPEVEERRQLVIDKIYDRHITIFPQSIFCDSKEQYIAMGNVYGRNNITVYAREKKSYELMKEYLCDADVKLAPDIVYSLNGCFTNLSEKSDDVYLCLRSDRECLDYGLIDRIKNELELKNINYLIEPMYQHMTISELGRDDFVENAIRRIGKAKAIITNRLHGCIFAAITNTPCVVLPNSYHKVVSNYEWIKREKNIKYVQSGDVKEIMDKLLEVLSVPKTEQWDLLKGELYEFGSNNNIQ